MKKPQVYTEYMIKNIEVEIERQWYYLLLVRAAFPFNFQEKLPTYDSPNFYTDLKIGFEINVPHNFLANIKIKSEGLGYWLNQNYVIRLFGILNEKNIITLGKNLDNPYTRILAGLRHNVGTHNMGYRKGDDELANDIIQYLDARATADDIFNLSIDTVLLPLKNQCVDFVKSIEGKEIPQKKSENH